LPENQSAIRLIDPPSQAIVSRRIAISESVLSDFNGLRRHSRVIESLQHPSRWGLPGLRPRWTRRRGFGAGRAFQWVARQSPSQSREPFLLFVTPRPWLRVAREKRKPVLPAFLKNDTSTQPAWQEIVDFS
jgi:hypothetical protein